MLIISDLHIGVRRSGGTTPQSQVELRDYIRAQFFHIAWYEPNHIVVNGDLFDGLEVDNSEVIETFKIIDKCLEASRASFTLISGNHDAKAACSRVSSFHLLAYMLKRAWHGRVNVIDHDRGLSHVQNRVWAISHQLNQGLFDAEIEQATKMDAEGHHLLLHCNYKNGFADASDHSLNLNDDQVSALMKAGWTLVIGHEHVGYDLREGRVVVVGNQFPSSVSDCIGDKEKFAVKIVDGVMTKVKTWDAEHNYVEVDWRELDTLKDQKFVRVTGTAQSAEAAEVIKVVSKLRQTSSAYVITNAVKVEGQAISDTATASIENLKAFDLRGAILAELTEQEQEAVKCLLN